MVPDRLERVNAQRPRLDAAIDSFRQTSLLVVPDLGTRLDE